MTITIVLASIVVDLVPDEVRHMLREAVDTETRISRNLLDQGIAGLLPPDRGSYRQHLADRRLETLGLTPATPTHSGS